MRWLNGGLLAADDEHRSARRQGPCHNPFGPDRTIQVSVVLEVGRGFAVGYGALQRVWGRRSAPSSHVGGWVSAPVADWKDRRPCYPVPQSPARPWTQPESSGPSSSTRVAAWPFVRGMSGSDRVPFIGTRVVNGMALYAGGWRTGGRPPNRNLPATEPWVTSSGTAFGKGGGEQISRDRASVDRRVGSTHMAAKLRLFAQP